MSEFIRHKLKELRLVGGRFEANKGWLDFDVLPELQTYKRLLLETAKEEWRRNNPGRDRLPKGFEDKVRLAFHEIKKGSCVVPIERFVKMGDDAELGLYVEDEVDEAVKIIDETILAAQQDKPFPENLPARIIPIFGEWGSTLNGDEAIEMRGEGDREHPRFDARVRKRILAATQRAYEDRIDLVGEVRAASLRAKEGGTFTIALEDGESIDGAFTDEQEARVTAALHNHHAIRVAIKGVGEFDRSGRLKKITRVDQLEERKLDEETFDPEAPPIWEVVSAIGAEIPEEEWEKVPTDLAKNLDHYLYGSKKEGEE